MILDNDNQNPEIQVFEIHRAVTKLYATIENRKLITKLSSHVTKIEDADEKGKFSRITEDTLCAVDELKDLMVLLKKISDRTKPSIGEL
jgi:squalene cyclase